MKGATCMSKGKRTSKYRKNLMIRSNEARTVRKIVSVIILSLILIVIIGSVSGYMYIKSSLEPVDPSSKENVEVSIPIGSSTSSIASILEENGIIKDARIFRFYIKFKNESDFQAGDYTFSSALTIDEIIESLKTGKVLAEPLFVVTIPEGKTVEEIAEIYSEEMSFSKDDFLEKVNDEAYIKQLIDEYPSILSKEILNENIKTPLEGYLFAATYSYYKKNPSIDEIIKDMLDQTVHLVAEYEEQITSSDFSVHEILTFASLIENETPTKEQRKTIAGVFYNRLAEGMRLQTDPTVAYAQGIHLDKVLIKDTKVESPYNTYFIDTLPIGPISNFAKNALEATLHPEETEYRYFLHDSEGNIHYSNTNEEHNELKRKYIK